MTQIYSILKHLIPHPLRTFLRDLDSAYHKLEKKIEIQKQQIQELEDLNSNLQTSFDQLQISYQLESRQYKYVCN